MQEEEVVKEEIFELIKHVILLLDFNNFSDEFLIAKKWLRQSDIQVDHLSCTNSMTKLDLYAVRNHVYADPN